MTAVEPPRKAAPRRGLRVWGIFLFLVFIAAGAGVVAQPKTTGAVLLMVLIVVVVRGALGRYASRGGRAGTPLLPEVLLLPTIAGLQTLNPRVALLFTAALVGYSFHRRRGSSFTGAWPFGVLLVACIPVWVWSGSTTSFVGFGAGLIALSVARLGILERRAAVISIIEGAGLYLVVSVVGYLAGVEHPTLRIGTSISTGGPFHHRALFPLSWSGSVPAIVAAAYLVGVATLVLDPDQRPHRRLWRFSAAMAAVFVLLAANYRAPLGIAIALWALLFVSSRLTCRIGPLVGIALFLLPFGYSQARHFTDPVVVAVSRAVPYLDRAEVVQAGVLSSRDVVWSNSLEYWRSVPTSKKIIGFGPAGQETSGASRTYAWLFKGGWNHPEATPTHNTALQQLYDSGLIGMTALTAGLYVVLARFARAGAEDAVSLAGFAVALTLVTTAATEVSLAPDRYEAAFWIMLVLAAASLKAGSRGADGPVVGPASGRDHLQTGRPLHHVVAQVNA